MYVFVLTITLSIPIVSNAFIGRASGGQLQPASNLELFVFKAIAWTTAAHRFTKTAQSYDMTSESSGSRMTEDVMDDFNGESTPHPEMEVEIDGRPTTVLHRY